MIDLLVWVLYFPLNVFYSLLNIHVHSIEVNNSTHADGLLVFLDILLKLSFASVGLVKGNLKFVDVLFKFLLDAESLGLTLGFSLKTGLDRLEGTLVVAAEDGNISMSIRLLCLMYIKHIICGST